MVGRWAINQWQVGNNVSKQVRKHLLLSERLTCVAHAEHATVLTVCPKRCAIIVFISEANTSKALHAESIHNTRLPVKHCFESQRDSVNFAGIPAE